MLTQGKREAERLFDVYSTNLSWYVPHLDSSFLCPLCGQLFSRDAIEARKLSVEHIVPSKAGGQLKTLTCTKCNNDTGSKLDKHFVQRLIVEEAIEPLRFSATIGKAEVRGMIRYPPEGVVEMSVVRKMCHPEQIRLASQAMEGDIDKISGTIYADYNPRQSRVALLRAGYLTMFHYFGYQYILLEACAEVRTQIANPHRESPLMGGVQWRVRGGVHESRVNFK